MTPETGALPEAFRRLALPTPPRLTLAGTARERGLAHGAALAAALSPSPRGERESPVSRAGHDYAAVLAGREALWGRMQAYLADFFPEVLAELDGIAEGAGLAPEQVRLGSSANSLSALPRAGESEPPPPGACSQVGLGRTERGPVLFKTDDLRIGQPAIAAEQAARIVAERQRSLLVLRETPPAGSAERATLRLGDWGTLWTECGVNEAGLALGQSSGHPAFMPQDGYGIPQHLFPLLLLRRCASTDEARDFALSHPLAGKGLNVVVVDALGQVLVIEKSGSRTGLTRPAGGVGCCTNHFRHPLLAAESRRQDRGFAAGAYGRETRARAAYLAAALDLAAPVAPIAEEDAGRPEIFPLAELVALVSAHPAGTGTLCKHGTAENDGLTGFSALALSRERRILFHPGPTCRGDFRELNWQEG